MISLSDILHGKILIVDDQEANILLLERILDGAGYDSISSTRDPNEVCDLHSKNGYDLILLDLEMPNAAFSGFQVMDRLKQIEPGGQLPVIVITAHPDHKLRALQAGARDFISKPFEPPELLARVHNMLEIRLYLMEMKKRIQTLEKIIRELGGSLELASRQHDETSDRHESFSSPEGAPEKSGDRTSLNPT